MALVAGVDSSTQSCKIVIRDADTGTLVRHGRAPHPDDTEVSPELWWIALQSATEAAGGIDGVAALSIAGQQHGMVCLDEDGAVVRDALLWNDTRSARAADELVRELGALAWAERVGTVPVASITITKLRWLAQHEPDHAARTAAVCLPHDWLTWRLRGSPGLDELTTDRSDASGTGYFDSRFGEYCRDLLQLAMGRDDLVLPSIVAPRGSSGSLGAALLGAGAGDNAAAMLGVDAGSDTVVSVGTSGVVMARHDVRPADPTGIVAGFADASGAYLPLACTLNAARVLDATAALLGGRPRPAERTRPLGTVRVGGRRAGALPRGRAHPEPAGRDGSSARTHAHERDAGQRRAGRRRRHAAAAWRPAWTRSTVRASR